MTGGRPELSIAICTRNRPHLIRSCVASVLESAGDLHCEILIVDQSTGSATRGAVESFSDPRIRYCAMQGPGISRARNHAIRLARGEAIAFTDDDCRVERDWVEEMLRALRDRPEVDAILGRTFAHRPDGDAVLEYDTRQTPFGESTHAILDGARYCHALIIGEVARVHTTPCLPHENVGSSNNLVARRALFCEGGTFSERLGAGTWLKSAEDTELLYRWLSQGHAILYLPSAVVYHDRWLERRTEASLLARYTVGVTAVFTEYALRGDPLARRLLRYGWSKIPGRRAGDPILYPGALNLGAFALGLLGGLYLRLRHRHFSRLESASAPPAA